MLISRRTLLRLRIASLALMVLALAPITWYAPRYFLSIHTRWCPLSHKLSDTAVCVLLDRDGQRLLIQHADLDTNERYLEIREGERSSGFEMPASVTILAPTGYTAELLPGAPATILLDGKPTELLPLARP